MVFETLQTFDFFKTEKYSYMMPWKINEIENLP